MESPKAYLLRLTKEEHRRLKAAAQERNITMDMLIKQALSQYFISYYPQGDWLG